MRRPTSGFVSLYTGVDFSGWQYRKDHEGHWEAKDWTIAYDGGGEASARTLKSEMVFGDAEIIADWRWTNTRDAKTLPIWLDGVPLTTETQATIARALATNPIASSSNGWRRALLTRRSGRLSLVIDRQTVFENLAVGPAGGRGSLVLQPQEGAGEIANLFVKRLP